MPVFLADHVFGFRVYGRGKRCPYPLDVKLSACCKWMKAL